MKKVIIFGAGGNGKNIKYAIDDNEFEIIAYVDNNKKMIGVQLDGLMIEPVEKVKDFACDYIILSMIKNSDKAEKQLMEYGIPQEKILRFENIKCKNDRNIIELQENRLAVMRMCISTIKERNVIGEVAEVGVYKGEFAQYLNMYFPDRKLYLFDTFEGMSGNKEVEEITAGLSFTDTSIERVMSKMRYPAQCIVKKGFFPKTAENVNDSFAFVSLDTDLYDSILAGLEFFYPKLTEGGYIFVHDYWAYTWCGVKEAVLEYCNRNSIGYVPINDLCGSIVITK